MGKTTNLFLCGVGGQGILLASEVISSACMKSGFDIKQSEVHGMAQRGGSVVAHLRFGEKVYSPLIEPGNADIVVSFELLEALRYLPYMKQEDQGHRQHADDTSRTGSYRRRHLSCRRARSADAEGHYRLSYRRI